MKEQTPGSFYSDESSEQPNQPKQESSMEKRIRAEVERRQSFITPERINTFLPTEDLKKAFGSIKAATLSLYNHAVLEKQQNVLEIREKNLFDEEIMKNYPTIYIGAGTDVEYPLSLGARNIVMVDPVLKEPHVLDRLRQRIRNLASDSLKEGKNHFSFKFDFGNGEEEVNISLDPRFYASEENEAIPKEERFVPSEQVGTILVFQGEDPTENQQTIEHLLPDGLILANRLPEKFLNEFFAQQSERHELFGNATSGEKRAMLADFYKTKGFDSISLESFGNNYAQTFLRKQKVGKLVD